MRHPQPEWLWWPGPAANLCPEGLMGGWRGRVHPVLNEDKWLNDNEGTNHHPTLGQTHCKTHTINTNAPSSRLMKMQTEGTNIRWIQLTDEVERAESKVMNWHHVSIFTSLSALKSPSSTWNHQISYGAFSNNSNSLILEATKRVVLTTIWPANPFYPQPPRNKTIALITDTLIFVKVH